jgi:hypothetical protein
MKERRSASHIQNQKKKKKKKLGYRHVKIGTRKRGNRDPTFQHVKDVLLIMSVELFATADDAKSITCRGRWVEAMETLKRVQRVLSSY